MTDPVSTAGNVTALVKQDLEVLHSVKSVLAASGKQTSAEWLRQLPTPVIDVLDRLSRMEDDELEAWHAQASVEDAEISELALELLSTPFAAPPWAEKASVFRFTDRITDVEFSSHLSFDVENPRPIIRLIFLSGEESDRLALTSDQDLEDTLHIGKSVCGSITETLRLMQEHGISLRPEHFGESFGEVLGELEETVSSLRRLFGTTEEPPHRA